MKTTVVTRDFFQRGDVVVDNNGVEYIYIEAKGFSSTIVKRMDGKIIEVDRIESGIVFTFHPDFNPGQIAEIFA